jgi:hypothetical protein
MLVCFVQCSTAGLNRAMRSIGEPLMSMQIGSIRNDVSCSYGVLRDDWLAGSHRICSKLASCFMLLNATAIAANPDVQVVEAAPTASTYRFIVDVSSTAGVCRIPALFIEQRRRSRSEPMTGVLFVTESDTAQCCVDRIVADRALL